MKITRDRAVWAVTVAAWVLQSGLARACEGCKQAVQNGMNGDQQLSAASIGYGWSVGFMLLMTFSVLGSLGWMMFRSCQNLARVHAQAGSEIDRRDS